jgi:hypothetical protein
MILIDEFSNEGSSIEQLLVAQRIHLEIALSKIVLAARAVSARFSRRRETVTKQD